MTLPKHPLLRSKLLTRPEAAEYLNLSLACVGRLIRSGSLPAFQIGRRRLVDPVALRKWLNDGCTSHSAGPRRLARP
jgi:excisionase family DNA binding protein